MAWPGLVQVVLVAVLLGAAGPQLAHALMHAPKGQVSAGRASDEPSVAGRAAHFQSAVRRALAVEQGGGAGAGQRALIQQRWRQVFGIRSSDLAARERGTEEALRDTPPPLPSTSMGSHPGWENGQGPEAVQVAGDAGTASSGQELDGQSASVGPSMAVRNGEGGDSDSKSRESPGSTSVPGRAGHEPEAPGERQLTGSVEEFLEEFVAFPGSEVCGGWAHGYSLRHQGVRSGASRARYITVLPDSNQGLGDRLLGIVSTFLAALLADRAIILADPYLTQAFDPVGVDWRPGAGALGLDMEPTAVDAARAEPGSVVLLDLTNGVVPGRRAGSSMVRFPQDLVEFVRGIDAASNIVIRTNGGVLTSIFSNPSSRTFKALHALGLRLSSAYPCILRYLLRPKPAVLRLLHRPLALLHGLPSRTPPGNPARHGKPATDQWLHPHEGDAGGGESKTRAGQRDVSSVCLHLRVPDSYTWNLTTGTLLQARGVLGWVRRAANLLLDCASAVTDHWGLDRNATKWLFMTESPLVRQLAKARFPQHVVLSEIQPQHPSLVREDSQRIEAFRSALADWLLFATCQYYIIVDSGFSKTAMAFNGRVKALYHFRRPYGWGSQMKCQPDKPTKLAVLGRSWSGL